MADLPSSDTFRVTGASLGGVAFDNTIGGSITETVTFLEDRPGARLSPASCIDAYGCVCEVKFQKPTTPAPRGTKDVCSFALKTISGSAATISVANIAAGAYKADFNSKPHSHTQEGTYDAGDAEELAPISVA